MKKRFSIWVREYGSDHDVELMEMDGDTKPVVAGLWAKRLKIGKRKVAKYSAVYVVDNGGG